MRRTGLAALAAGLILGALGGGAAVAHDVRPGYLSLTEREDGRFDALFKIPAGTETRLALEAHLPPGCREVGARDLEAVSGATVERWIAECGEGGIEAGEISIGGLQLTLTDVLLRVEWRDGSRFSTLLRPDAPSVRPVRGEEAARVPVLGFLRLGVEHILLGIDHLLFVLCLLLLVEGSRRLFFTITSFTVAHSVTLALATLGVVRVPPRPVEASIALSIVLLAVELVRKWRGEDSLTARRPWLVAFSFGLLHGLGFAGALSQVGLPEGEIPLALFLFNVGVEAGQLLFVLAVLAVIASVGALGRRARVDAPHWGPLVPAYTIGVVATTWLFQRVAAML